MTRPLEPEVAPRIRLFSLYQIGGGAFVGSPLAGTALLALNYLRLDRRRAAHVTIMAGAAVMVLLVVLEVLVFKAGDKKLDAGLIQIAASLSLYRLAEVSQGPALAAHKQAGGRPESGWVWAGISLGFAVTLTYLAFRSGLLLGFLS